MQRRPEVLLNNVVTYCCFRLAPPTTHYFMQPGVDGVDVLRLLQCTDGGVQCSK